MNQVRPLKPVHERYHPLPMHYFENYADPDTDADTSTDTDTDSSSSVDVDHSYAKNWRDYGFNRFNDYLRLLKETYARTPDTVFEFGSADGSVIEELLKQGFRARGCENSLGILRTCKSKDVRKLICYGSAYEVARALPDNSYDCIYETAAQYLKPKLLKQYFKELQRIAKNDMVIVLHTVDEDPEPHEGQVNHLTNDDWINLICDAGFVLGYINNPEETTAPFWFRKIGV